MQNFMINIGRLYVHRKYVFMYIMASLTYIIASALNMAKYMLLELADVLWVLTKILLGFVLTVGFVFGLLYVFFLACMGTAWAVATIIASLVLVFLLVWWILDCCIKEETRVEKEYTRKLIKWYRKKKYERECRQAWNEYYSRRNQKLLPCKSLIKVE